MEKELIKKYRADADSLQSALFLEEMAEQGLFLVDMSYTAYTFRQDAPQSLKYLIEERAIPPTAEELAEKEAEGWKFVCKFREDYVFSIPRSMCGVEKGTELQQAATAMKQELTEEIEYRNQYMRRKFLLFIPVVLVALSKAENKEMTALLKIAEYLLIPLVCGIFAIYFLKKRKYQAEDLQDDTLSMEELLRKENERKFRKILFIVIILLLCVLVGKIC